MMHTGVTFNEKTSHFFKDLMEIYLKGLLDEHHTHPVTPDLVE